MAVAMPPRAAGKGGGEMGKARPGALALDAGALIAFERADPRLRALFREALRIGARLVIPAGVVGQVHLFCWMVRDEK